MTFNTRERKTKKTGWGCLALPPFLPKCCMTWCQLWCFVKFSRVEQVSAKTTNLQIKPCNWKCCVFEHFKSRKLSDGKWGAKLKHERETRTVFCESASRARHFISALFEAASLLSPRLKEMMPPQLLPVASQRDAVTVFPNESPQLTVGMTYHYNICSTVVSSCSGHITATVLTTSIVSQPPCGIDHRRPFVVFNKYKYYWSP